MSVCLDPPNSEASLPPPPSAKVEVRQEQLLEAKYVCNALCFLMQRLLSKRVLRVILECTILSRVEIKRNIENHPLSALVILNQNCFQCNNKI